MKRFLRTVFVVLLTVLLVLGVFLCLPPKSPLWSGASPVLSYDEAVAAWARLVEETPANVREDCRPEILTHGKPTDKVFVFLHGLANSPLQFSLLARQLFDRGHNVVIARLPYHGEKNRMTTDWANLTGQEMIDSGNQAVDIARSLGRDVVVAGLSVNGTVTAWMAHKRGDLHKVVLLSPFLVPVGLPEWSARPLANALVTVPNTFVWWDSSRKENLPGPEYAYPRFPTRVIGQVMLLGDSVLSEAQKTAPAAPSILVVTTASDQALNNEAAATLVKRWRGFRSTGIETYEFPAGEKVPHDFVDPNQPDQQIAIVYPKLIELLEAAPQ